MDFPERVWGEVGVIIGCGVVHKVGGYLNTVGA